MRTLLPVELPYSGTSIATYYEANHNTNVRGPVGPHRVILGSHFSDMEHMTDALGEAFNSEDEELKRTIALSGLRDFMASLRPPPGGTDYDKQWKRQYLSSATSAINTSRQPFWGGGCGPYHELLGQRISTFDFARLVNHVMTNTELQDCYGKPRDPRLMLIEGIEPTPPMASAS